MNDALECLGHGLEAKACTHGSWMDTLGHSQISLTLDTYWHVLPSLQAEAARQMDPAIGCPIGCQDGDDAPPEPKEGEDSFGKKVSLVGIEPVLTHHSGLFEASN